MSNKSLFILCIYCCFAACLYAQQDSILIRIDNEVITRSEFETAYQYSKLSTVNKKTGVRDYLPHFINDRLKMIEAKVTRIDTTLEFRTKVQKFGETLRMNSLAEKYENVIYHNQKQKSHLAKRYSVMQIYKYIPQNCSNIELEEANRLMDQLHQKLITDPQVDFNVYVQEYSDSKGYLDIGLMESPVEFEQKVFSMHKGEVSAPFFTPQGIHIVKVIDIKDSLLSEEINKKLQLRLRRKYRNGIEADFLQQLKNTFGYTLNQAGVNELFASGKTDKVLFTLNGRAYTGNDFRYFAEVNPKGIRRQFDDFVVKCLVACENEKQEIKQPEYEQLIEVYKDSLLLSLINEKEVINKARTDKAGLSAYFSVHKKDYRWARPRFRGVVLHTRDKQILSEAKRLLKKKPFSEWKTFLIDVYNAGVVQQVEVEQGLYKEGDNIYVDDRIFRKGKADSPTSYPFTVVIGKKIKGPENYEEAPETLIPDYEKFLETQWIKHLHHTYRVEINQEVLKTVNNH